MWNKSLLETSPLYMGPLHESLNVTMIDDVRACKSQIIKVKGRI